MTGQRRSPWQSMGARLGVWAILLLNLLLPVHHLHAMPSIGTGHAGDHPTPFVIGTADGHVEHDSPPVRV